MKTLWCASNLPPACLLDPLSVGLASPVQSSSPDAPSGRTDPKETRTTRRKGSRSCQWKGWCWEEHGRRLATSSLPVRTSAHELSYPVNLAFTLAMRKRPSLGRRLRVGILDLDIFGPSVPTLMGLQHADEPALTSGRSPAHWPSHPLHYSSSKRRRNVAYCEPWTANHVHGIPASKIG